MQTSTCCTWRLLWQQSEYPSHSRVASSASLLQFTRTSSHCPVALTLPSFETSNSPINTVFSIGGDNCCQDKLGNICANACDPCRDRGCQHVLWAHGWPDYTASPNHCTSLAAEHISTVTLGDEEAKLSRTHAEPGELTLGRRLSYVCIECLKSGTSLSVQHTYCLGLWTYRAN